MRRIPIVIEEKLQWIFFQKVKGEYWLHYEGETHVIAESKSRKTRIEMSSLTNGEIYSPMPGKIIKINKLVGEEVVEGQTIVVLEAMKMEYSLAAECTGKVVELNIKEGQQVKLGDLLVKIIKESDG